MWEGLAPFVALAQVAAAAAAVDETEAEAAPAPVPVQVTVQVAVQVVAVLNPGVAYMLSQNAVSSLPAFSPPRKKPPASDILSPHPVTHLQDKLWAVEQEDTREKVQTARSVSIPWS